MPRGRTQEAEPSFGAIGDGPGISGTIGTPTFFTCRWHDDRDIATAESTTMTTCDSCAVVRPQRNNDVEATTPRALLPINQTLRFRDKHDSQGGPFERGGRWADRANERVNRTRWRTDKMAMAIVVVVVVAIVGGKSGGTKSETIASSRRRSD